VRSDGRLFARTRVEYDLLFTNRLIAKPFVGVDWAARSLPAEGIKAGATSSEWGLNLRYEITRAVAPYLEVSRQWQREASGSTSANSVRAGLRLVL
jgi:copper resistance protein B